MADPTFTIDSPPGNNQAAHPPGGTAPDAMASGADTAADTATEPLSHAALCREIGRRLRARRRERRLSQEELGWRADCHRTYISQIERGTRNPTLANLYRLALALDVPLAALCPGGDGPSPPREM